jgi:hypothetical protein
LLGGGAFGSVGDDGDGGAEVGNLGGGGHTGNLDLPNEAGNDGALERAPRIAAIDSYTQQRQPK